jgi:PAS domain S-box-containing protein
MSVPLTRQAGPSACDPVELLHDGKRVRILRARRCEDGAPIVLKVLRPEAATGESLARFEREARLLERLRIPGVIRLLESWHAPTPTLVLEPFDGPSLDRVATPMPLATFLPLAAGVATTLAALHERNVIHKALSPAHILFAAGSGEWRLIDFDIADEVPQRMVAPRPPAAIEGPLPFISPEQTGRMNRAIDYRTDFYSLGATFYWLLTGTLPFEAPDDLGLIHCHLAATPVPPHLRNPQVPETLSHIVMKLLAKMPDDRYQSAHGLIADLEHCLRGLREQGTVPSFPPGREDYAERLQMPQRLFGREAERRELVAAFDHAAEGRSRVVFVAGYSGVGKTALVRELQWPVLEKHGRFIEGKFDQLRRNVPYSAFAQALDGFITQLLMEDETALAAFKQRILQVMGNNGRLLTDVIPALEQLTGPQPPVPALAAGEASNRFVYLFMDFIGAIASPEHPLALFLDDLQWIDAASLNLLHQLARATALRGVLLIGGYRDNEVDQLHPLAAVIEALRAEPVPPQVITLASLPEETTNELIAHMLHEQPPATAPLARLIFAKTGGNAFFTLQMLKSLAERGAIRFDAPSRHWRWDLAAIAGMEISGNVVSLMEARLRTLAPPTRRILTLAACLGFRFSLANVAAAAGVPEAAAAEALQPALHDGLVVPMGRGFQFAHDRVRQAAYAQIPEAEKAAVHLSVGRLLLPRLAAEAEDDQIFTVVDNLDAGRALLDTAAERLQIAELNLRAGLKAKHSAAFAVAGHYFRTGFELLPADGWQNHYLLTLALHQESAQCEYLAGNHELADRLIAEALRNTADALDQARIHAIQMMVYTTQNRFADCIAAGRVALRLFQMEIPDISDPEALQAAADQALAEYREQFSHTDPLTLSRAGEITDPQAVECMELLLHMVLPAYYLNRTLYALLTTRMANLALRHGNSSAAALGYVLMAAVSVTELRDFRSARDLGELAMEVNRRFRNPALEGEILMFYANTVAPWFLPLAEAAPIQRRGFALAMEAGSLNDAANCLWGSMRNLLASGAPLEEAMRECDNAIAFTERIHDPGFRVTMVFMRQIFRCFMGHLTTPQSLDADDFNEVAFLDLMQKSGFLSTLAHYNIFKGWTLYVLGRFDEALSFVEASRGNIHYVADQPHSAYHYFHHSLLLLRRRNDPEDLALVAANQERLELFVQYCPRNYRHLHLLVEAERARIAGRVTDAAEHYDRAIEGAVAGHNLYVEGLACELAGRFWLAQADDDAAERYLSRAHRAWSQWQARPRAAALEAEFPHWIAPRARKPAPDGDALDLRTLMKATRAISSEMELPRLVDTLMRIVIENAGAQRGALLLDDEQGWQVVSAGSLDSPRLVLPAPQPVGATDLLPTSVVRLVARTRERIVLDDARQGPLAADDWLRGHGVRSLLCAPILGRGRLIGIFYLENNLTTGAFTPARVEFLEMLLAQAAVSLDNARAYDALRANEAKYRRLFDTTTEGILALDTEGRISFGNAHMARLLGYSLDDLLGRPYTDVVPPDELPALRSRLQSRRTGVSENYELRLQHRDGGTVWTVASACPIFEEGRFTGSFAMFTDISERRRAEIALMRSNRFFRTLSRCNETLVHATDETELLRNMCQVVVESGSFAQARVSYLGSDGALKSVAQFAADGSGEPPAESAAVEADDPEKRAARSGETQVVSRVADDRCAPWARRAAAQGYGSSIALPLRVGGRIVGVLSISAVEEGAFGPEEVALLSELAGDLGFGIDGLRVRRDREQFIERLRASMEATIQALSSTVERRDPSTAGHQRRVAQLAAAVARSMGWTEERVQALFLAGMVHDIGKIAVPADILSKPGQLSAAEYMLAQTHVEAAWEILDSAEFSWPLARIVQQHHERLDGSGYPLGLRGDAILPEARVLAVCDVFEAMTNHRPYRPGHSIGEALAELESGKGTRYDAQAVDHCARVIRDGFRFS